MDDLIYKQDAIDEIDSFDVLDGYQDKLELKSKIEKLPSAKNKAFEEVKAELYEREVQAQADKERYPDNEYLEGVFDGLHEAAKLMSIAVPTAKPRKGKWIDYCGGVKCDQCGFECDDPYYLDEANYCPNCGTRMEAGDD